MKLLEGREIKGLVVMTQEDVQNMLIGALEGGSNFWYELGPKSVKRALDATPELEGEPTVDRLLKYIQSGGQVNVFDVEQGINKEGKLGTITHESWAKAEKLMIEKHRRHLGDILSGNDDASTADVFFQLAVMGEVVYG